MHHSSEKPKTKNSIFTILIALIFFYGMGHLTPAFIPTSTSSLFNLNGPSLAYAEEDEDEEDEEDEEILLLLLLLLFSSSVILLLLQGIHNPQGL